MGDIRVVLDCAHNPHGAAALVQALSSEGIDPRRTRLVFGALSDKAWRDMLRLLVGCSAWRYYAEPSGRAPAPLAELCAVGHGRCVGSPRAAIRLALAESAPGDTVLVTGSIFLVGEVRAELLGIVADAPVAL